MYICTYFSYICIFIYSTYLHIYIYKLYMCIYIYIHVFVPGSSKPPGPNVLTCRLVFTMFWLRKTGFAKVFYVTAFGFAGCIFV